MREHQIHKKIISSCESIVRMGQVKKNLYKTFELRWMNYYVTDVLFLILSLCALQGYDEGKDEDI